MSQGRSRKRVTVESPEGPDFELQVPAELAALSRSLTFGKFDLQAAELDDEGVTLSFWTLEGMEEFLATCLRPLPDDFSARIGGSDESEQPVEDAWRYTIGPNAIFTTADMKEPNIAWSSSVRFPRSDLPEVEARVRARPPEFQVFLDQARDERHGTAQRWRAKDKVEALREAVAELEKGEFRRARLVRFDPESGEAQEEVVTLD